MFLHVTPIVASLCLISSQGACRGHASEGSPCYQYKLFILETDQSISARSTSSHTDLRWRQLHDNIAVNPTARNLARTRVVIALETTGLKESRYNASIY